VVVVFVVIVFATDVAATPSLLPDPELLASDGCGGFATDGEVVDVVPGSRWFCPSADGEPYSSPSLL